MIVSKAALRDYISRDFDNFLWIKRASSGELRDELCRFDIRPRFKTEPWDHQLACFIIGYYFPRFLFLLDMGLGKTKIILDLLTQALREKRATRALILVPRRLNMADWVTAAEAHSDLEPYLVDCQSSEEKLERLLNPRGDFTVIDYAGLHLATSEKKKSKKGSVLKKNQLVVEKLCRRYDFITADESHMLSNHQSLWFSIARQLTATAAFTYATTGTLFARDLEGIWSQFYLVDRGETFGPNLGLFRAAFFTAKAKPFGGVDLTFNQDQTRLLHRMIGNRSLRYEDREVRADVPPVLPFRQLLRLPGEQKEHYLLALQGLINAGNNLEEMDAQWFRMRQITSGYLEWKDEYGEHELVFRENPKLVALEKILDESYGNKVVITCEYVRTGKLISDWLRSRKISHEWLYGGTKDPTASKERFIKDPACRVLLMNSSVGGTGVNGLQWVAHVMVIYETPPMSARAQVIKRLDRSGQEHPVRVVDLAVDRTIDVGLLDDIALGRDLHDRVMTGKADLKKLFG